MANTIADINIDMIGRRDEAQIRTTMCTSGADRLSSETTTLMLTKVCSNGMDYKYNDPLIKSLYERSDYYICKERVPLCFYLQWSPC
jgi:hypothetical protein